MSDSAGQPATVSFDRLRAAFEQGVPHVVVTAIAGEPAGLKLLVFLDSVEGSLGDPGLDQQATADARALLAAERSATRSYRVEAFAEPAELFFDVAPAPPTLLIVGAVHVAQALSRFAKLLGFQVIVADARAALATVERFPDADQIIVAWPDDALGELSIGPNTAIAILTHDPKFDEPALTAALETPARYIGAVGSRKTNEDRRERLRAAGVDDEHLARLHAPIGLNIGGETPEEMALSILAEMVAVRHSRPGGPLTTAQGSIRGQVAATAD